MVMPMAMMARAMVGLAWALSSVGAAGAAFDHQWAVAQLRGVHVAFGACVRGSAAKSFAVPLGRADCAAGGGEWRAVYEGDDGGDAWQREAASSTRPFVLHAMRVDVTEERLLAIALHESAEITDILIGQRLWAIADRRLDVPEVVFAERETPRMVIDPSTENELRSATARAAKVNVTVELRPGAPARRLRRALQMQDAEDAQVTLTNADPDWIVRQVANNPDVRRVAPDARLRTLGADASAAVQSGFLGSRDDGLELVSAHLPFHAAGVNGAGQIVTVADTGLDMSSCFFRDDNDGGTNGEAARLAARATLERWATVRYPTHRKVSSYTVAADHWEGQAQGHGTFVAGIVAGARAGVQSRSDGVAPGARIAVVDLGVAGSDGLVSYRSVERLFRSGWDDGSRIFSNSWGVAHNSYGFHATGLDRYTFERQDALVIFAAGNDGALFDSGTVTSPAVSKNVLTVGASQSSSRTWANRVQRCGLPAGAGASDSQCGLGMAPFSSAGPTSDGRQKPDLVAPGYYVSTAASSASESGSCFDAQRMGTSMSAPVVSGAAALVRQWLVEGFHPSGERDASQSMQPMGALLKAILVHAARPLPDTPRRQQGYGVPSLWPVLMPAPPARLELWGDMRDMPELGTTGERWSRFWQVPSGATADLEATLVWYDPPASEFASQHLVNDLDLEVRGPNGLLYRSGGAGAAPDRVNTVERVRVPASALADGGLVEVRVIAARIGGAARQPFALAVTAAGSLSAAPEEDKGNGAPVCGRDTTLVVATQHGLGPSEALEPLEQLVRTVIDAVGPRGEALLTTVGGASSSAKLVAPSNVGESTVARLQAASSRQAAAFDYAKALEAAQNAAPGRVSLVLIADGEPSSARGARKAFRRACSTRRKQRRQGVDLSVLCVIRDAARMGTWARRTSQCLCDATFEAARHGRHVAASAQRVVGLICGTADELANPGPSPCAQATSSSACAKVRVSSFGPQVRGDPALHFREARGCRFAHGVCADSPAARSRLFT